jgi:hypothetical protein
LRDTGCQNVPKGTENCPKDISEQKLLDIRQGRTKRTARESKATKKYGSEAKIVRERNAD